MNFTTRNGVKKDRRTRTARPGKITARLMAMCVLLLGAQMSWGQTTVTIGGGASVTCPTTPTATYTTPPTGATFSNWSRGSGVTCGTANNALSGSGFNTPTSAAAGVTANKFYAITITADATHTVTLSGVTWNTTVSSGTASFGMMYSNNGGAATAFGTVGTSTTTNSFSGSVVVAANTSLVLYFVPYGTGAAGTTVRLLNGSTITVTAAAAVAAPTQLAITSIPTSVAAGAPFSVTVNSQNGAGTNTDVTGSTTVTLTNTGGGTLGGTTTSTISSGNTFSFTGLTLSSASAATITATVTSGTTLTAATSSSFNVTGAPTATTNAASAITATGATLNGSVNAQGLSTTATFEYGTTTGYGNSATATQSPVAAGYSATATSKAVTGLTPNTTYHYRADAVNATTTTATNGTDATFTTLAAVPAAPTVNNATLTSLDVTISSTTANTNPAGTQYIIQETTTGNYVQGNGVGLGASQTALTVSSYPTTFTVTGLTSATSYTFKVLAINNNSVSPAQTVYGPTAIGVTTSSNSITTGVVSTTVCAGSTLSVPFTYTPAANFTNGTSTFTAQLSDASGSFASPTTIGTVAADASGSQAITGTIAGTTTPGAGYLVRVVSDVPAVTGSSNASNITISNTTTSIAPATAQNITSGTNGNTLTVTEAGNATGRVWQYATTSGGPYTTITGQTGTSYTPNFVAPNTYYVVATTTYGAPCSTTQTSNEVTVNVSATLATGTVSSAICAGSAVSVPFTYTPTTPALYYNGATFTAQLSDASGSFTSPTTIGTIAADNSGSQTISATIPSNMPTGSAYRVRVVSASPTVNGTDNGSNIAISSSLTSIAPATAQNIFVNTNGTALTVTDGSTGATHSWQSATVSGGPYTVITGQTGTTYTPNFAQGGTYYIVEVSTYGAPCSASVTSNEVRINVTYPNCTISNSGTTGFNFDGGTGTASPSSSVSNITTSAISVGGTNGGTATLLSNTSASTGYTGASGNYNAGAAPYSGAFNNATTVYFAFTLTPATGYSVSLTGLNFGSRSTSTGPVSYQVRTSIDNYATATASGTFVNNSTWALFSNPSLSAVGALNTPVTVRIYGYGGTATSGTTVTWRVDDITASLSAATPQVLATTIQPAAATAGGNAAITLTGLAASTTYTVSYNIASGTTQTASATSDVSGNLIFNAPVTSANNGQVLTVTNILSAGGCTVLTGTNNTVTLVVNASSVYYSAATGNLNALTTFGSNADGTGTNPSDFTSDGKTYHIANGNTGALSADWTVSGTGSKIIADNDFAIATHNVNAKMTITAGHAVSVATGSTLTTNDSLVLLAGARIGASTGTITGKVVIQTLIPGQRGFRLLGQPYTSNIDLSQLYTTFDITGLPGNIGSTCTGTNPSVFSYTPGAGGYVAITSNGNGAFPAVQSSSAVPNGILAFVRGSKGQDCSSAATAIPNDVTITTTGAVNEGDITETVPANGWNLIANPYPSQVALSGVDNINNLNAIVVVQPGQQNNGHTYTNGSTYFAASTSYILPINGAFLANNTTGADITLTFHEASKSTSTPTTGILKTTNTYPMLELSVYNGNAFWDIWHMSMKQGATGNAGETGDLDKMANAQFNISSLSTDNKQLAWDTRDASSIIDGTVISLNISSVPQTTYTLQVTDNSLPADKIAVLHDKYTNAYVQLNNGTSYPFTVNSDTTSQGKNRMEILFSEVSTGVNTINNSQNVSIVPNPATRNVTLSYNKAFAGAKDISIINALGQVVRTLNSSDVYVNMFVGDLPSGVYLVRTTTGNNISTERFIKN